MGLLWVQNYYYLFLLLLVPTVFCLLQVEKQRVNKTIKSQQFEDAKNEYASQLQKTNEAQAKYYNHFKPQVLTNFQDLDERRIKCIQVNRVVGHTTLQYVMNAKLSKHRFWHCHENGLIKTIQTIPHNL